MKNILLILLLIISGFARGQKIDSIYFHLYTDSLKKGVHNYINVDGKTTEGRWLPLTAKEIQLSCNFGRFEGNDLVLPADFNGENVTVKAALKTNPSTAKEIIIWVKKNPDNEHLPTKHEILNNTPSRRKRG